MHGKLVLTRAHEIHIETQIVGNEVLVTARQTNESPAKILCTIKKQPDYSDEFILIPGSNVTVLQDIPKLQEK